jgi:putative nucleotidyltransferase with HDIG domain
MDCEVRRLDVNAVVEKLRELIEARGGDAYLIGGCVRDRLLGRPIHDLDLAVRGDAIGLAREAANRLGGAFYILDEENATARVIIGEGDERLDLDFAAFRGQTLEDDLRGRDFTIGAMALSLADWPRGRPLIDPFGGERDLRQKRLRAVTDEVFRDDPVRLLRAVRLEVELGLRADAHTESLVRRDHGLIARASAERLRDELTRSMAAAAVDGLCRLDALGLLTLVIPELSTLKGLEQPTSHRYDAFEHTLKTIAAVERMQATGYQDTGILGYDTSDVLAFFAPRLSEHFAQVVSDDRRRGLLLRFAALLHDLGKPMTHSRDEGERIHFYDHEAIGAQMAADILRRLRFSTAEVRLVKTIVAYHLRPLHLAHADSITQRAVYRFFRDTHDAGVDVLMLALADYEAKGGAESSRAEWDRQVNVAGLLLGKYFDEYASAVAPPKLIEGGELIDRFGVSGPRIGELLEAVREAQAAGDVGTHEEALAYVEKLLTEKLSGGGN